MFNVFTGVNICHVANVILYENLVNENKSLGNKQFSDDISLLDMS